MAAFVPAYHRSAIALSLCVEVHSMHAVVIAPFPAGRVHVSIYRYLGYMQVGLSAFLSYI